MIGGHSIAFKKHFVVEVICVDNDLGIFRSIQFLNKSCLVFFLSWGERMDSHELFGGSNYEALFFRAPH